MIFFFQNNTRQIVAVQSSNILNTNDIQALCWLFGQAEFLDKTSLPGFFIGPRREMLSPWSTTSVEITQNMNIPGIERIELFIPVDSAEVPFDPMLEELYDGLDSSIFTVNRAPEPIRYIDIDHIEAYNQQEGLALSPDEVEYLKALCKKMGRKLTDSELFGFSQVNSEHCRHKIFNGTFIIDGKEKPSTLFQLIKRTSAAHPNLIVSAYKDNCAFIKGADEVLFFKPATGDKPDFFTTEKGATVLSLKAETHNFPTTVEPFNGGATGSGGEIRDRMAGGTGAQPLAGIAVYMTSYPRLDPKNRPWESTTPRKWRYQTPQEILTKASNGASDFGNKFGQPLICGSLLTFEHTEDKKIFGFDKVIMLAGGIGYAHKENAQKGTPQAGDKVVMMGGDNYRIGMGGGAVSSVATGQYGNAIELNAVQRSNPEMQKRVYNAIRTLTEQRHNPIVSIHDHGAGGHLNCLSELLEATGGVIDMSQLPVGDSTLSAKEIIGNESQERMGLVLKAADIPQLQKIAERERAPLYVIGEVNNSHRFTIENPPTGEKPVDMELSDLLGKTPITEMVDNTVVSDFASISYNTEELERYLEAVLQLDSVACKDWLVSKVDRCVSGWVANQPTLGEIQLPLNNFGAMALSYEGKEGVATALGHAPGAALIDAAAGSRLAIAEALTNIVWAPLAGGLSSVSLSANWMWPCRNAGEDARLYEAVEAASNFCIDLGINIPTGKDSLSMTQKYTDGAKVLSPGTVIITAIAPMKSVRKPVRPLLVCDPDTQLLYIDFSQTQKELGGSAFAQVTGQLGDSCPDVACADYFARCFNAIQSFIGEDVILSGHDVSAGGTIVALLELCFAQQEGGLTIDLSRFPEPDPIKALFAENPAVVIQVANKDLSRVSNVLEQSHILFYPIGKPQSDRQIDLRIGDQHDCFDINRLRDLWFHSSYLMEQQQTVARFAAERFKNYKQQPLRFRFPQSFTGKLLDYGLSLEQRTVTGAAKAAIIREKGSNGDREMAWMLYQAGFEVKDVHMTDLISGRESLDDIRLVVFVGGFSNADTLGSAKGWAGSFLYNQKAKEALERFYARTDTLSLGVCNGCQLMAELGLITGNEGNPSPKMRHNASGRFECGFVNVEVPASNAIMLQPLAGSRLGAWISHGEGRFDFPEPLENYNIALRYSYEEYPGNPNGSPRGIAGICSADGRHLAMMPHPERSIYPWNWAHYPNQRGSDEVSPWIEMFVGARKWLG
ncbi:MAG: phosphoribosylformylglycinamidine synthase [Bacteroidales bacterium]|nr:phosphoribosylformylglycinamidine synthase [Bacteroidales bacterium]